MKLVMTAMVRDEADIIAAMLNHHIAQGVDKFVVTDNGSVDGTREILEDYAARGYVDLRHDSVHRKQQGVTVTGMARDAYSVHGADWVLNADADEFWLPRDRHRRLREVFEGIPIALRAFTVPVVDMTGAPAASGSGMARLRFRDLRPVERLEEIGLHAHSTPNAVHVGSPDVEVVQGNHYVNIESHGDPDPRDLIEVLHIPWRSWSQYRRKVENAGRAYENDSGLTPSPNHHGMRDWRRLEEGVLAALYLARHPDHDELTAGIAAGHFIEDTALVGCVDAVEDVPFTDTDHRELAALGRAIVRRDRANKEILQQLHETQNQLENLRINSEGALQQSEAKRVELTGLVDGLRSRKIVRLTDAVSRLTRR